jgi:hypothetical protein
MHYREDDGSIIICVFVSSLLLTAGPAAGLSRCTIHLDWFLQRDIGETENGVRFCFLEPQVNKSTVYTSFESPNVWGLNLPLLVQSATDRVVSCLQVFKRQMLGFKSSQN